MRKTRQLLYISKLISTNQKLILTVDTADSVSITERTLNPLIVHNNESRTPPLENWRNYLLKYYASLSIVRLANPYEVVHGQRSFQSFAEQPR